MLKYLIIIRFGYIIRILGEINARFFYMPLHLKMPAKLKQIRVSLRFSILSIFISLFLVTVLCILGIWSFGFSSEMTYSSLRMMNYVSDEVLHELSNGIQPLEVQARFSANLLDSGVLTDHEQQLLPYTFYLVSTMPLVRGAYWADAAGNVVYSHKTGDGTIASDVITRGAGTLVHMTYYRDLNGNITRQELSSQYPYDARTRPWYVQAKNSRKVIWTDIYEFYPHLGLGITTAAPVIAKDGTFRGVFGLDISLEYLTRFVSGQNITANGYSFIITRGEDLVAYPHRPPFTMVNAASGKLFNVHQAHLPFIDESLDIYKQTGQSEIILKYQHKTYLVTYRPVGDIAPQGWLIGVVTPRSDLIGMLKEIRYISVLVSLFILLLGILVVSRLVTRIVSPINELVKETDRIRQFDLEGDVRLRSRIKEVVFLRNAVRAMKRGLRQFQLYVPKTLVRQLIQSGREISQGGEHKQLVVLFSDIQNFTSISHHMEANQLMVHLCEYFEALSQIILEEGGTIDKYMGDSVMAFWGAPITQESPWMNAARAALKIQSSVSDLNTQWKKQGKPRLITRIGIHMGDAIVGNLGSSERLNYTAIGDTINITSRLEGINKVYHTSIIVSEEVYLQIRDKFVLRMVDCVTVRGRSGTICVYELLGDDPKKLGFDIDAYRKEFDKGFTAFKLLELEKAKMYFQNCLKIYPDDNLAPVFIHKCEKHS